MTNKANQKHNTICVGHQHAEKYTNNLNNPPSHKQLGVKAKRTTMVASFAGFSFFFFWIATSVFSNIYSNMTSFFRFVNKRDLSIGYLSLAHAPVHVPDFPVANIHK
jgi:hypothetical protein